MRKIACLALLFAVSCPGAGRAQTSPFLPESDHRALVNEIHARSTLRIVDDPAAADLVVRGRIRSFTERVLADEGRSTVTENSVEVALAIDVTDRAGARRTLTFRTREPYSTFKGQRLATARAEAFENLAEEIVFALDFESPEPPPTESP